MVKRFLFLLLPFLILFSSSVGAFEVLTSNKDPSDNFSALLYDFKSDRVIYEKNSTDVIIPASLVKLMTMYIAFEYLKQGRVSPDDPVLISKAASDQQPSKISLEPGQKIPFHTLLLNMIVASANDATYAIAEHLAGGNACAFVDIMNKKAIELGMNKTHYSNPHGLNEVYCEKLNIAEGQDQKLFEDMSKAGLENYTSAVDLMKLSIAIVKEHEGMWRNSQRAYVAFDGKLRLSTNSVGRYMKHAYGLKTGFTSASGFNLVSIRSVNGLKIMGIITGAVDVFQRDGYIVEMLHNGSLFLKKDKEIKEIEKSSLIIEECEYSIWNNGRSLYLKYLFEKIKKYSDSKHFNQNTFDSESLFSVDDKKKIKITKKLTDLHIPLPPDEELLSK